MLKSKARNDVTRISAEWTERLATVDTVLGRLEVLGSLRDPHTGRYVHHGMSICLGRCTHDVLLKSHEEIFADWQEMHIEAQMQDLRTFVVSVPVSGNELGKRMNRLARTQLVLETWTELESYRTFVPLTVSKLQRDLFLTNLSSIIAILRNQLTNQVRLRAGAS